MAGRVKIIPILIGAVSLCAVVRADMVSLSPADTACVSSQPTRCVTDSPSASSSSSSWGFPQIADFGLLLVRSVSQPDVETGQGTKAKSPQILADRQNSLSLCLYALVGLGLCRTAPWVKRLHFGCLPDWYHGGGPYQIGHSFATAPNCLSSVPVACFVQRDYEPEDISLRHLHGTILSLLRGPQATFWELGSRGPP